MRRMPGAKDHCWNRSQFISAFGWADERNDDRFAGDKYRPLGMVHRNAGRNRIPDFRDDALPIATPRPVIECDCKPNRPMIGLQIP